MAFEEQLPQWENEGTQPPQSKRVEGWLPNEKPPASWFNWLLHRAYKALQELQQKAATTDQIDDLAGEGRTTETVKGNADAIADHIFDADNPHNVTKQQVGLGNVDNVQQATKTEFDTHKNASNNPHGVTKEQVGLGNVQNYGMATKEQAEAGTATNLYMSPLRTKEAIDMQTRDSSVVLGGGASVVSAGSNNYGVAIGSSAEAKTSVPIDNRAIAIGRNAKANSQGADPVIAIGVSAEASTNNSIALGYGAKANNNGAEAIGGNAQALNYNETVLGTSSRTVKVPGSLDVAGTKNFEIPHPHPDKKTTHVIRHGAVESPTAGDTLYRYTVEATEANETVIVQLPDYFQYLNTNVDVWVNGTDHFGRAFGKVIDDKLYVTCELAGAYKVLVIGTRNDGHQSVQDWHIKGVEREIGESWTGETYVFEVDEIIEVDEITEVAV